MKKRFLSIIMAAAMVLSLLPMSALAAGTTVDSIDGQINTFISGNDSSTTITLDGDATFSPFTLSGKKNLTIDLAGYTLKANVQNDKTTLIESGASLVIMSTGAQGTLEMNNFSTPPKAAIEVIAGSSLTLKNIQYNTDGTGVLPREDATEVNVENSTITAKGFCIGTNAGKETNYHVTINLTNSIFNGTPGDDAAGTAVFINVPGLLNINNCEINGYWQGMFVRGGTAVVQDSEITNKYESDKYLHTYDETWGTGNALPLATLTLGNKTSSAYNYPTDVTLINTTLTSVGPYPAVYAWANEDEENGVTLTYKNCDITGDIVYGNDGKNISVTGGKNGVSADTAVEDNTVSSSVSGVYTGEEKDEGVTAGETIEINVKAPDNEGSTATTSEVAIAPETLTSVSDAETVKDVEITTDVGTLTVTKDAWDTITTNAKNESVTLSIEKKGDASQLIYTLTATAGTENVFTAADGNGTIDVTVPYDEDTKPSVYYLGEDGAEKVDENLVALDTENDSLTWTVSHFSDWLIREGDEAIAYKATAGDVQFTDELNIALTAVAKGGTITVYGDVEETEVNAEITGAVTINGTGTIKVSPENGVSAEAFVLSNESSCLTLDGVALTITGVKNGEGETDKYDGTAFNMNPGSELKVTNGAVLTINNLNRGIVVDGGAAPIDADITVTGEGSKLTASNFDGNFSQGGQYVFSNGACVEISNCVNHGLSANTIEVDNAYVNVHDTGFCGIITSDANAKLELKEGAEVTVENCATGKDSQGRPAVQMAGSLIVPEGTSLTVSGAGERDKIKLAESSTNNDLTGVHGDIVTSDDSPIVAVIEGGSGYATLADALTAANKGTNKTVTLLANEVELGTTTIGAGVILEVPSGKTLKVAATSYSTLFTSQGTIRVQAGGAISVDGTKMIGGSDANIALTGGYIDLKEDKGALALSFVGATAEIPTNHRWALLLGGGTHGTYHMNVTLDTSTILTVNGSDGDDTGFHVANGSTLTNNGKIVVNSSMSIGSSGTVTGSTGTVIVNSGAVLEIDTKKEAPTSTGKLANNVTNNGTVVYNGTANSDNITGTITLTSGGKVYSQADISDKLSGSYRETSSKEYGGTAYTHAWEYYVSSGSSGGSTRYTVTAPTDVANGSVKVSPTRASYNQTVTVTVTPDEGYQLASIAVTDRSGNTIEVERGNANQYTFKMPRGAVSIAVTFEEIAPWTSPYVDVIAGDWFYGAVEYVVDNGLMTGTSSTTFEPDAQLTRGMMATVLWAMSGGPVVNYAMDYTDVSDGDWYAEAVRWATSTGVVTGMGDGTYEPNSPITREQMMVMLYAYAVRAGYDVDQGGMSAREFDDYGEISGWAVTAMEWAVNTGMIGGKPGNILDPGGNATRAEVATILRNYHQTFVAE